MSAAGRLGALLTPGRAALLGALLALAAYANAPENGFAYDDVAIIERDTTVHSLAHVPGMFARNYWGSDTALALYRPLTTLTFALDWAVSDGSAAWFHVANVLWHALATALGVLLIARLFGPIAAFAGGAIFALHPVHVEAVANVVGRAEILAAVAVFAAALAWLRLQGAARTAVAAVIFALGLLAKESVIALPLLLALVDLADGRLRHGAVREYLRAYAGAYAVLLLVALGYLALRAAVLGSVAPTRIDPTLEVAPGHLARVLTALQAWPHYLRLLFYPRTLLADYGPRIIMPVPPLTPAAWVGLVVIVAAAGWGWLAFRLGRGRAALLLLWVPVALLPVSNLIVPIGVVVAERLLYVPSLAVAAAAGALVQASLAWDGSRRGALLLGFAAVVGLAAVRTWTRTADWRSTDHVFAAQLMARPDNFRTQWHRARALLVAGDDTAALNGYRIAVGLWPFRQSLLREAAVLEATHGDLRHARGLARFGVQRWPGDIHLQRLLAGASLDLGDTATARAGIRAGLAIDSTDDVLRRMRQAVEPQRTKQP